MDNASQEKDKKTARFRIRVGRQQFADPHYLTNLGDSPNITSIEVNKNPPSWKKRATAQKHLDAFKERFSSAEIEAFYAP